MNFQSGKSQNLRGGALRPVVSITRESGEVRVGLFREVSPKVPFLRPVSEHLMYDTRLASASMGFC